MITRRIYLTLVTTFIALSACAMHNDSDGYYPNGYLSPAAIHVMTPEEREKALYNKIACAGNPESIRSLMQAGTNISIPKQTYLSHIVAVLTESKLQDERLTGPLALSIVLQAGATHKKRESHLLEIVKILVNNGIHVQPDNLEKTIWHDDHNSPLYISIEHQWPSIMQYLLTQGASATNTHWAVADKTGNSTLIQLLEQHTNTKGSSYEYDDYSAH